MNQSERNAQYKEALEALKEEHRELEPEYNRVKFRMFALKRTIIGLAGLLDEDLDDEFMKPTRIIDTNAKSKHDDTRPKTINPSKR